MIITPLEDLIFDRNALISDYNKVQTFIGAFLDKPKGKDGKDIFEISRSEPKERTLPSVAQILKQLTIVPELVRFIVTRAGKVASAHRDTGRLGAINIPISGYENSRVVFYDEEITNIKTWTGGIPAILNVSILHEVYASNNTDRVTLTLGFKKFNYTALVDLVQSKKLFCK